jgi:hypothetical protein
VTTGTKKGPDGKDMSLDQYFNATYKEKPFEGPKRWNSKPRPEDIDHNVVIVDESTGQSYIKVGPKGGGQLVPAGVIKGSKAYNSSSGDRPDYGSAT